jgi:hypothetical protein
MAHHDGQSQVEAVARILESVRIGAADAGQADAKRDALIVDLRRRELVNLYAAPTSQRGDLAGSRRSLFLPRSS